MNIKRKIESYEINKNRLSLSNISTLILSPLSLSFFIQFLAFNSIMNFFSFIFSFILSVICFYSKYSANKNLKVILTKLQKELKDNNVELVMILVRELMDKQSPNFIRLNDEIYYRINDGILTIYKNEEEKLLRVI